MNDSLNRANCLAAVRSQTGPWDIVVVGGGATGVGIALDAASRGYRVALFEQSDFGKGTSSRSTKLIHGGVRYLAQGNVALVREALHERTLLLRNAPGLVHPLGFVIPVRNWAEGFWYRSGIAVYDLLAGPSGTAGRSGWLNLAETRRQLPGLAPQGVSGGVRFFDAQFDDARLLIAIARSAAAHGAVLLNYARVCGFIKDKGDAITGVELEDPEHPGASIAVEARVVINATGAFTGAVRERVGASNSGLTVSRGSHVVVDRGFLPSVDALLIPKTSDGRVLFAIPWHNHTLLGTTDIETTETSLEPRPAEDEISFILDTAGAYLAAKPRRSDVRSAWAGIRPLFRGKASGAASRLSREHALLQDAPRLLTIIGGKWTTWRRMAEDCVDLAASVGGLPARPCRTGDIRLFTASAGLSSSEAIHPAFPWTRADVTQATGQEMALTVDDVLARRTRILFLNAQAAIDSAARVAHWMAEDLGQDAHWEQSQVDAFTAIAKQYLV